MALNTQKLLTLPLKFLKSVAKQIKSKQRVAEHGEVFTAEREVNAMLDLVKSECIRPDSRFLEPAWKTRARVTPRAEEALTPDNFYD